MTPLSFHLVMYVYVLTFCVSVVPFFVRSLVVIYLRTYIHVLVLCLCINMCEAVVNYVIYIHDCACVVLAYLSLSVLYK